MKKLLILLVSILTLATVPSVVKAQKATPRIAVGASVLDNDVYASLAIGGTTGKNSYGVIGETFNPNGTFTGFSGRQYSVGLDYLHAVPVGQAADFVVGATGLVHLGEKHELTFRPETGVQFNFGKVGLLTTVGFPIRQNQVGLFNPIRIQGGVQAVIRF